LGRAASAQKGGSSTSSLPVSALRSTLTRPVSISSFVSGGTTRCGFFSGVPGVTP